MAHEPDAAVIDRLFSDFRKLSCNTAKIDLLAFGTLEEETLFYFRALNQGNLNSLLVKAREATEKNIRLDSIARNCGLTERQVKSSLTGMNGLTLERASDILLAMGYTIEFKLKKIEGIFEG
jgi:DNA-binding phage protein